MVMNSTAINGEHNSSKAPLIVDTAALNNEDFTNFLTITDEMERNERTRRSQRRSRSQGGTTLKATMTREEIFECSTLDDDKFLTALEFQNSYVPPSPSKNANTDISRSIENLMKYFDEEVPVDCRTPCGTPTKIAPGKVAAVVANFKTKSSAEAIPSPMLMPARKIQSEIKPTIKELKKKYEASGSSSSSPRHMACNSPAKPLRSATPQKKVPVETPTKTNGTPQKKPQVETPTKTKSPKGSRKSKVRQMAQMFNAKITQYIKREPETPVHSYSPLHNELSPEAKPLAPRLLAPRASPRQTPRQSPRSRRKVPMPSPRSSRKPMPVATPCLVAEDVFRQLSVKDKALLYNKFINDMSVKHPKFGKHADIMQEHVKKEFARGEVVAEKQETVKHLRAALEATCTFPKHTVSPLALQRVNSVRDGKATLPKRRSQSQSPPTTKSPLRTVKSREAEDILNSTVKCADEEEHFDYHEEDSLHISTLTVVLKPSPESKGRPSTIQRNTSKLTLRKKRELDFLNCLGVVEPTQKRHNESLRSTFSTEAYAPPKKIRRTRTERVTSSMFFQNPQLEQLFYNWLKEKNGVSFDIASVGNMEETITIAPQGEQSTVSVDEEGHKSAVEKLLEEAIAKLENVELSQKSRDAEERQRKEASSVEEKEIDTAATSVVANPEKHDVISSKQPTSTEVGRAAPIAMPRLQTPVRTPRKKKPAPPIPAQRQSVITDSSASSSAKQSDAEESESGLSSNPKPPENELQKSHDQNPAALSEHQLRVQASLQRLNIPDWFRQYNQNTARSPDGGISGYKPGNFTRKRATESGRWAGLNSKTTSLSSLGSQRSDRSPLLLSPSAHSHHGGQTTGVPHAPGQGTGNASHTGAGHGAFSRWSTSHLNSSQTSPSVSQRGTFIRGGPVNSSFMSVASGASSVIRNSYRQPYLGWRSTEKLSQRTPHERLASSMLQQQRTSPTQAHGVNGVANVQAVTPEIQSSIKEVTSAIVHYVNDQTNEQRSRSTSPNSRKCWLESSFVGVRPLDSPQTPVIDNTPTASGGGTNFSLNNSIYQSSTASTLPGGATGYRNPQSVSPTFINAEVVRMNGRLSIGPQHGGAPESSMSSASLEDVLASLLGLPTTTSISTSGGGGASTATDGYARSSTTGNSVSEPQQQQQQVAPPHIADNIAPQQQHMPQQVQPLRPQQSSPTSQQHQQQQQQQQLLEISTADQQRLRRRSEGDAPNKLSHKSGAGAQPNGGQSIAADDHSGQDSCATTASSATVPRRVSLGDSTTDGQCKNAAGELQIKCRNTKCDRSATPTDAKKYYKSCHNCTHLYCSRECRRAHWEKHRKACLHSRASNLCRQVLATCKDDVDSQRHLSLLARKGFLSQGRGVVRVLFRSAEAAEGFIKHGFQCMGEASYVRWPDLMPAEMGLELYSELLKLSTEYKPESKMLIYVAICVVSEAPGMGQAPVRWERQLVSRCAKLKLCKSILHEMEQQQLALQQQPLAVVAIPEPTTEILILTFNPGLLRSSQTQRELILSNTLDILSRRGVFLRKHYPEIYQRLQTYTDGQTDKFNPVTLHPRDSQTGQSFVCIIMPVHSDTEIIKLPSIADGGNRVTTIDVGSPAALAQLDDDELLTRSTS